MKWTNCVIRIGGVAALGGWMPLHFEIDNLHVADDERIGRVLVVRESGENSIPHPTLFVDFKWGLPPVCLLSMSYLPNFHLPNQNWAYRGRNRIKVNKT